MAEYPEHEKLTAVKEKSQLLGEFLDWVEQKGYVFCYYDSDGERGIFDRYRPIHKPIEKWLAEFYEIDLKVLEEENQQMLAEIRGG